MKNSYDDTMCVAIDLAIDPATGLATGFEWFGIGAPAGRRTIAA